MTSIVFKDYSVDLEVDGSGKTSWKKADISVSLSGNDPGARINLRLKQRFPKGSVNILVFNQVINRTDVDLDYSLGDLPFSQDPKPEGLFLEWELEVVGGAYKGTKETKRIIDAHKFSAGSYSITPGAGLVSSSGPTGPATTKNNMNRKSLFQSAVSAVLQFGRDGSFIKWDSGKFIFTDRSGTEQNVAVAAAKADEDAVNLGQLKEKLAELAKKGGMTVADLDTSSNPWGDNEVRVTTGLKFKRKTPTGTEDFTPADGTVFSVAKELTIAAGHIANGTGSVLKADHIFIYDAPTGKAYDNGAIGEAYNEKGVAKKMAIDIDSSGSGAGMDVIPKDSRITGCTVYVNGAFDGVPNNLQLKLGSDVLLDFGSLDLTEPALIPVDLYSKLSADSTPAISGSLTGGSKGEAVVFLEYVAA